MPGVVIHAHLVAQYLDGRRYHPLPEAAVAAIIFSLALSAFLLGWRFPKSGLLTGGMPALMLAAIDALLFSGLRLITPSAPVILAWLAGVFGGRSVAFLARRANKP